MRQNTLFKSVPVLLCLIVWFIDLVFSEILNRVHLIICDSFHTTYRIITSKHWGKTFRVPNYSFSPLGFCALTINFQNALKHYFVLENV